MTLAGIILVISVTLPAGAPPGRSAAPFRQEPSSTPATEPNAAPQTDSTKPSTPVEPDADKKPVQSEPTAKPPATSAPEQPSTEANQQDQKAEPPSPAAAQTPVPDKPKDKKSTKTRTMKRRVVRNGSTTDPQVQISPGLSPEQATTQTQSTTQLLAATEGNLKKLSGRSLSAAQQQMLEQVRRYVDQAHAAMDAGDLQRGHTLAFKARLLSDELALR